MSLYNTNNAKKFPESNSILNANLLNNRSLTSQLVTKIFQNTIKSAKFTFSENYVKVAREALIPLVLFYHLHSYSKFNTLLELTVVDTPGKLYRFNVQYYLLSVVNNLRLKIVVYTNEIIWLPTLTKIFDNADWLEREAWDTYGVFFLDHPNLRRILMDYGFSGFPFRKDFPLSGFRDLRYQENTKRFQYIPVKNIKFRKFKFNNPWWTA